MCCDRRTGVVVPGYNEELLPGETPASIPDAVDGIAAVNGCSHGLTEQQTVLAAIPAYNAERSIAGTVLRVRQYVDQVLVVDDGSVDATGAIATDLGARVVRHPENRGYSGALQTIFQTAREMGVERLVILDADGRHNPADIPALLSSLDGGADVVIGSRFLNRSKSRIPSSQKVGMKVFTGMTDLAGGIPVTDSQSGFRAYGRRAIEAIHITGDGMSAGSECLIQAAGAGLTIAEVPITVRSEIEGTSGEHPVGQGIPTFMQIIRSISCSRPLPFFGIPGLLFTILGAGAELYTFSEYLLTARFHYIIFTVGAAFLMMGLLLVTAGMILYPLARIILGQESRTGVAAEVAAPPRPVPSPRTRGSDPCNLAPEVQQ